MNQGTTVTYTNFFLTISSGIKSGDLEKKLSRAGAIARVGCVLAIRYFS
jgi:hypothetical protein